MTYSIEFTKALFNAPANAVYAFVNEEDKRIYITYCTKLLASIDRNIANNRFLYDDRNKLQLIILSTDLVDKKDMMLMTSYWCSYYRNNGYSLYKEYKHIEYKARAIINKNIKAEVQLVSRNNSITVVGVFDTMAEADSFIVNCLLKQNGCILPVYALNKHTKDLCMSVR